MATLVANVPRGENWAYEIKWDGYRLALHIADGKARAITRGGHDWTHRFPAIIEAAERLHVDSAILDGEAVVLDESGRPSFSALQQALGGRGGKQNAGAAVFYAFDLLFADGHDLRRMELEDRRAMLDGVVPAEGAILLSEEIDGDGRGLLEKGCQLDDNLQVSGRHRVQGARHTSLARKRP